MSYWPPPPERISVTISSDEPAYFACTLQPLCCSNGFTHFASRYPSHAIIVSFPSPFPEAVVTSDFPTPAAGMARAATTATSTA